MVNVRSLMWSGLWTSFSHSTCLRSCLTSCLVLQCMWSTFSWSLPWLFSSPLHRSHDSFTLWKIGLVLPRRATKCSGSALCQTSQSAPPPLSRMCCVQNVLQVVICPFISWLPFAISLFPLPVSEDDELSETMIISDQFLATCTGLQQTLASYHWTHVVYSALPSPRPWKAY